MTGDTCDALEATSLVISVSSFRVEQTKAETIELPEIVSFVVSRAVLGRYEISGQDVSRLALRKCG